MSDMYRVVLAVTAERLPELHKLIHEVAHVAEISHWYDQPAETLVVQDAPEPAVAMVRNAARELLKAEKTVNRSQSAKGITKKTPLVALILSYAERANGVSRSYLKSIATSAGFNPGSVSPTLVKLMADKKIKRIGKGVYATRAKYAAGAKA